MNITCMMLLVTAFAAAPAWAGLALVGNENGGTISLIDTDKDARRRQTAIRLPRGGYEDGRARLE